MSNHRWENNICINCGLKRETANIYHDDGSVKRGYHYSFDGKNWNNNRYQCISNENISIKNIINKSDTPYSELLKNPKWQRKRLEIFQRDKFTCKLCKDIETALHVHHKEYIKGNKPWDYPDNMLVTLCEHCHKEIEEMKKDYPECSFAMYKIHKSNNWTTSKRIMFTSLKGNACSMNIYDENDQFIVGFNFDYEIQNIINILKHTIKNG